MPVFFKKKSRVSVKLRSADELNTHQCGCGYEHLQVAVCKQLFTELSVCSCHAGVVDTESIRQEVLQIWVRHILALCFKVNVSKRSVASMQ
jgi:hypothetical protein